MKKPDQIWEVKNGKAVLVTPAKEEKSQEVPIRQLDREIERAARRKEQLTQALARAQAEYDEGVAYEAELTALRAQVED